ncbi:hypothetical protein IFM89_007927 [Coptis chinensis]|uniref:Uncharacterized protein n=1 Tax=Coptis chinensis TaxID=261450 RepID=A0A835IKH8_9MAGN|nr:hypothetical protein IFM89_007927 [Coptis chinensis]
MFQKKNIVTWFRNMRAKLKRKALINAEKDSDEIQVEIQISPKKTKPNNMEETSGDIVPSQESQHQVLVRKTTTTKSTPVKRKQRRKTQKRSYKSNRLSRMKRFVSMPGTSEEEAKINRAKRKEMLNLKSIGNDNYIDNESDDDYLSQMSGSDSDIEVDNETEVSISRGIDVSHKRSCFEPLDFGCPTSICSHYGAIVWYEERNDRSKKPINPKFSICCHLSEWKGSIASSKRYSRIFEEFFGLQWRVKIVKLDGKHQHLQLNVRVHIYWWTSSELS